ncbi:MAG: adenylate/guanylate cyclase domain-containing protein [Synechococcaceae cyanobacterium]|nr:adenylate/guanylate cyclase domain-containing protein [Synechococcaceae cyanobacterium]
MTQRPPLWLAALLLPLLLAALERPPLELADSQLRSLFFLLRGSRPSTPRDPLLLAIDVESLSLEQRLAPRRRQGSPLWRRMGPWPWPRSLQAELAAAVLERGAHRVVFAIVHAGPSRYGPADDAAFARRLSPWRRQLVLAAGLSRSERAGIEELQLQLPPQPARARLGLTTVLQNPQGLSEAIPGRRWLHDTLADFPPPHPLPLAFAALERPLPEAPLGIDFPGPAGTLPTVPAWQVLEQPAGFWRGRTVLIGATAEGLGDQLETPFGPQSGAEVQAAALATVLAGGGFHAASPAWLAAVLLGWAGLAAALLRRGGSAAGTAGIAGSLAAAALGLSALAWSGGLLLPATALIAAPLLGGGVRASRQWQREAGERTYLHQVLAHRISPALLEDILRDPGPIGTEVGGVRSRCVVLFTDLVGFTPLSAQLEPAALFGLLNRYFETIAAAVIEERGLLDKFIGDALMAEFGVPRSRGDSQEAEAAVRAALAMQRRLNTLNDALRSEGLPALRQGIGLHVGEVIAGNLGSSQRLEYTVVGAAVNVASRLEGLSRRFPEHPILISGELLALLPDALDVTPLGEQSLKGWPEPVAVYGLHGLRSGAG